MYNLLSFVILLITSFYINRREILNVFTGTHICIDSWHLRMKPIVCHIVQQCPQILNKVNQQTVFHQKKKKKSKKRGKMFQNVIAYLTLRLEFLVGEFELEDTLGFRYIVIA